MTNNYHTSHIQDSPSDDTSKWAWELFELALVLTLKYLRICLLVGRLFEVKNEQPTYIYVFINTRQSHP